MFPNVCDPHGIRLTAAGGQFGHYKVMQRTCKMTEILEYLYSLESTQRELSNQHQHDMVCWFQDFWHPFALGEFRLSISSVNRTFEQKPSSKNLQI